MEYSPTSPLQSSPSLLSRIWRLSSPRLPSLLMSSRPTSPPETPRRESMAIENQKSVSKARGQDGARNVQNEQSVPRKEDVQVPATQTPSLDQDEAIQDGLRSQLIEEERGNHECEDAGTEISGFDWEEFEKNCLDEITAATVVEDDLLTEFHDLANAFSVWAQAASEHDNERAAKRLKTRERYVQLSEQSLADKKQHYVKVVKAFEDALELFKN